MKNIPQTSRPIPPATVEEIESDHEDNNQSEEDIENTPNKRTVLFELSRVMMKN